MRRTVVAIALVIAAFAGYRYVAGRATAAGRYRAFAEEILHRRYDAAAAMADGLTSSQLAQLGTQERIGAGPPMFQTLFPSRFSIESEGTAADGTVTITAIQTVLFNPAGVESAVRPAMFAEMKQVTSLRKTSDGWRVTAFDNVFRKMDSVSGR
jgi:hypothetical protein